MGDRLEGRVAIVTGAGGGIGREHALLLASEGASVVVNDIGLRRGASATDVADAITAVGGSAVADTTSATWDGAASIVEHALDEFGRVDVLVNNATTNAHADLWDLSEEGWDFTLDVHLKGYFAMVREVTPHFGRQGSGVIVNTSSAAGFGLPASIAYSSAKEGVIGMTRTIAREVGRFGVRCNAIRPLALATSFADFGDRTARWAELIALTTAARGGRDALESATAQTFPPSKIAPFTVWLCTDAASNVNGRVFHVRGDVVSLFNEPLPDYAATIEEAGGWTLDRLDEEAPSRLVGGLENEYTFDDHPELKIFPTQESA